MKLAHFRRHKRKTVKKVAGKTTSYPFHKPEENHPPGKDPSKKVPKIIAKATDYARSAKSKKVNVQAREEFVFLYYKFKPHSSGPND